MPDLECDVVSYTLKMQNITVKEPCFTIALCVHIFSHYMILHLNVQDNNDNI